MAVGSSLTSTPPARRAGFTLLELLVVVAIMAIASAGVGFAMHDSSQTRLEREAQRLAALLESGRAQSRASGVAIVWHTTAGGFLFDGAAPQSLPDRWLASDTVASNAAAGVPGQATLTLGPEPLIGPQAVLLSSASHPGHALLVATDGLRPFSVQSAASP